jgi:hypothetical protein
LGEPNATIEKTVLLRDIKDVHYPSEDEYQDFDKHPRWVERTVARHYPTGLIVHYREFFAFVDRKNKEWDYNALATTGHLAHH